MHLKQLKLAGFKSFVDPTVVHFPSQLVAVVGPNGCGKSNIIDAVRWVMGESSARNLRGESMADVIFNGSSQRKPVGQACVELVFDNSLGRLVGPFASYGEIAVKRIVTRSGDSSYYLNGSRCRRKDITDIFLGTGAGARGYSIIGQGTISQLIEAKPEDLRIYLEEAAGVSKYKERRKETLQRIAHTRDNLTRVADIREELGKQLQRLERQAQSAERYLILKEKEQLCRAEILALKWQDFIKQQEVKQAELQELALNYEQQQSRLTHANTQRLVLHENLFEMDEKTKRVQEVFYHTGTDIARLEEIIQQQAREKSRLEQALQQMQADWQMAQAQLKQDQEVLLNCQHKACHLEQELHHLKIKFTEQESQYQAIQKKKNAWDLDWQDVQIQSNTLKREFQVTQVNARHLEEKQQQTLVRLEKLTLEKESISMTYLQQEKHDLEGLQITLLENQKLEAYHLQQKQDDSNQLRIKIQDTEQQLHQLQDNFHRTNSDYAALVAAQGAARQGMQSNKNEIHEWSDKPRLMDILQVDSAWQTACERVLNEALHAYVLGCFDDLWPQQAICMEQGEHVVTMRTVAPKAARHPRLIDKIQGAIPATVYSLEHIYTAEHFDEARSWLPDLTEQESIITKEGFWLGQGWVKFIALGEPDELGLLARQQKIADLSLRVNSLEQEIQSLRVQRDQHHQDLQHVLNDLEAKQLSLNDSNDALRANTTALSAKEQAIFHADKRIRALASESDELLLSLEEIATEQERLKVSLCSLEEQCGQATRQQEQCMREKQEYLDTLAIQSQHVQESRKLLHQAELDSDREKNKIQQLEERINREQEHVSILQERLENLAHSCLQTENPRSEIKEQLNQQLLKHTELESQLTVSREELSQLRAELEVLEKNILNYDVEVRRVQELIGQVRMQEQAMAVRASSVQESLDELSLHPLTLLEQIPEGITQNLREDELIALTEQIKRLGAINLAAIEEFSTEQQRKLYLDEQYDDLCQALTTLEAAIEKMDEETRQRLETTFAEVNTSFKALFPRLFGGGTAQLELTCDNLLEAGIVVMAQPPGKRNSTIHLLSGGEKAMTAVALVFAIFQLNPSPFCMLDEVDAPLDDVNVGRFCALVKEMSQVVQFLFITHNKVTMELAEHLMGVTMREPGVSRLVAVDVKQALAME
jgi:chromosome segregation protein